MDQVGVTTAGGLDSSKVETEEDISTWDRDIEAGHPALLIGSGGQPVLVASEGEGLEATGHAASTSSSAAESKMESRKQGTFGIEFAPIKTDENAILTPGTQSESVPIANSSSTASVVSQSSRPAAGTTPNHSGSCLESTASIIPLFPASMLLARPSIASASVASSSNSNIAQDAAVAPTSLSHAITAFHPPDATSPTPPATLDVVSASTATSAVSLASRFPHSLPLPPAFVRTAKPARHSGGFIAGVTLGTLFGLFILISLLVWAVQAYRKRRKERRLSRLSGVAPGGRYRRHEMFSPIDGQPATFEVMRRKAGVSREISSFLNRGKGNGSSQLTGAGLDGGSGLGDELPTSQSELGLRTKPSWDSDERFPTLPPPMPYPSLPTMNLPPISFGMDGETIESDAGLRPGVLGSRSGTLRIANLLPGDISDSESMGRKSNMTAFGASPVSTSGSMTGLRGYSASYSSLVSLSAAGNETPLQLGESIPGDGNVPQFRAGNTAKEFSLRACEPLRPQKRALGHYQRNVSMPTSMSDSVSIRRWGSARTCDTQPRLPSTLLEQHQQQLEKLSSTNMPYYGSLGPASRSLRVQISTFVIPEAGRETPTPVSANLTPLSLGWASSIRTNISHAITTVQESVTGSLGRTPSIFSYISKTKGEGDDSPTLTTAPRRKRRSVLARLSLSGVGEVEVPLPQSRSGSAMYVMAAEGGGGDEQGKSAGDEQDAISIHFVHSQSMASLYRGASYSENGNVDGLPRLPFSSSESNLLPTPPGPLLYEGHHRSKEFPLAGEINGRASVGDTLSERVPTSGTISDMAISKCILADPAAISTDVVQLNAIEEVDAVTPTGPPALPPNYGAPAVAETGQGSSRSVSRSTLVSSPQTMEHVTESLSSPVPMPSPITVPAIFPELSRFPTPPVSSPSTAFSPRPGSPSRAIAHLSQVDTAWSSSRERGSSTSSPSSASGKSVKSRLPVLIRKDSAGSSSSSRASTPRRVVQKRLSQRDGVLRKGGNGTLASNGRRRATKGRTGEDDDGKES